MQKSFMKSLYKQVRSAAQIVNNAPISTPCVRGNGACCYQPEVPSTTEDHEVIIQAAKDGKIPKHIIDRALKRAFDPLSKGCPFLGDNNECTIYPYRPVICMMYGTGAGPSSRQLLAEAMKKRKSGKERGLKMPQVRPFLCDSCMVSFNPRTVYPTLIVEKTLEVWDYIAVRAHEGKAMWLTNFVKYLLPAALKPQ